MCVYVVLFITVCCLRSATVYMCASLVLAVLFSQAQEVASLLVTIRPFFNSISKAKTEKIVTSLIKFVSQVPDTLPLQIDLTKESITWCKLEKRTFLRQRLQARLAALYVQSTERASERARICIC
jgi:hypothetical protein